MLRCIIELFPQMDNSLARVFPSVASHIAWPWAPSRPVSRILARGGDIDPNSDVGEPQVTTFSVPLPL